MILIRSDTKRKAARHYSIMIIPQGSSRVRRLEFSVRALKASAACAAAICMVVFAGAVTLLVYRHYYKATEDVRIRTAQYEVEREALLKRVSELEGTLTRVERFASKIESAMNVSSRGSADEMNGRGPVEDDDWQSISDSPVATNASLGNVVGKWKSPFSNTLGKGLQFSLDKLSERLDVAEEKIHSVFALQKDSLYFWASLPTLWPANGWITSEFGDGRGWGGHGRRHEGIDIAAPRGTPVLAPGSGIVTYTGYRSGYGKIMIVDHGYGISTVYAHCQSTFVGEGQMVKRGMMIGTVGNTGRSTGPHLHYEVHVDGVPVDPMLYVMNGI